MGDAPPLPLDHPFTVLLAELKAAGVDALPCLAQVGEHRTLVPTLVWSDGPVTKSAAAPTFRALATIVRGRLGWTS